jgi:hypothetical protein
MFNSLADFTGVLQALLNLITLWVLKRTLDSATASVNTSQLALEVSQRPYVVPAAANSAPLVENQKAVFGVQLRNVGNTPALDLRIRAGAFWTDQPLPETLDYEPTFQEGPIPLGRDVNCNVPTPTHHPFNALDIQDITARRRKVHIYGVASYTDIFNKQHETRWCFTYNPQGPLLDSAPKHNSAS